MSDIERTSLDAHVSLCALRYQALDDRLTRVENNINELSVLVREVHHKLSQQQNAQWGRWDRVQWALIGVLGSIVIGAVARALGGF
jgi:hypothetical protein